jgi:D-3-phosphoglycerate dehydrogenase / 2-oxoglutarate reductase
MNQKVLITLTDKEYDLVQEHVIKQFKNEGVEVIARFSNAKLPETEVAELVKDVDGYIFGLEDITRTVMESGPNLKGVCKFGIGTDNVDKIAAKELGVKVANCPGLNSLAVAELSVGTMLGLARGIPFLDHQMKNRIWNSSLGTELSGKTLGIIGFGNIGKYILKLLRGFGMDIKVYDVFQSSDLEFRMGFKYCSLDEIYASSDFISLNIPLTEETKDLITLRELKQMKNSAFLINMARGGIVREDDLLRALNLGEIRGAAIDAFKEEPTKAYDLVNHPRVIALPHIGAASREATIRIGNCAFRNILNVIRGEEPLYCVEPESV